MNMRLTSDLETQINKRKKELEILNAALALIGKDRSDNDISVEVHKKETRGTKLGAKRGPYKSHKKKGVTSKSYRRKLVSPNWKSLIPSTLKKSGKALTTREITSIITPLCKPKAMRIQIARCSASLHVLAHMGKVKFHKTPGVKTTYSLINE